MTTADTAPDRFATTPVRYDIITTGGTATCYRESARLVANRSIAGRLSDIEVVVKWGGHEGRAHIQGSYAVERLSTTYVGSRMLSMHILKADLEALWSLVREANDAHAGAVDKIAGYDAVRATVAAALGADPSKQRFPATREEVGEWYSWAVAEKLVGIVRV